MSITAALVNLSVANNGTWTDAFQFGTVGDTSWSFTGQNFVMDIKASRNDVAPLLTLHSTNGTIVVDDVVQRVLHFNVPDTVLQASLPVGEYEYDLVMYDGSVPPVRIPLMQGNLCITQGVTDS